MTRRARAGLPAALLALLLPLAGCTGSGSSSGPAPASAPAPATGPSSSAGSPAGWPGTAPARTVAGDWRAARVFTVGGGKGSGTLVGIDTAHRTAHLLAAVPGGSGPGAAFALRAADGTWYLAAVRGRTVPLYRIDTAGARLVPVATLPADAHEAVRGVTAAGETLVVSYVTGGAGAPDPHQTLARSYDIRTGTLRKVYPYALKPAVVGAAPNGICAAGTLGTHLVVQRGAGTAPQQVAATGRVVGLGCEGARTTLVTLGGGGVDDRRMQRLGDVDDVMLPGNQSTPSLALTGGTAQDVLVLQTSPVADIVMRFSRSTGALLGTWVPQRGKQGETVAVAWLTATTFCAVQHGAAYTYDLTTRVTHPVTLAAKS